MALRRVFSQDDDFKESMFARQIAVMKGQAWNVVETLKQPDHGPLELTRRTRVCVWDDMVDVPVAIPLGAPSADMQKRKMKNYDPGDEEMDISAAVSGPDDDLLGPSSPSSELPNPNRFELSGGRGSRDFGRSKTQTDGSVTIGDPTFRAGSIHGISHGKGLTRDWASLPPRPGHKYAASTGHYKHGSLSSARAASIFGGDDLEGDLGYSAAQGMEGHQRKVIVERLEAVKSKNPVFTWC